MREKPVRVLSMFRKYIAWTVRGKKKATTQLSLKPFADYELCHRKKNGEFEHSGVIVRIHKVRKWTLSAVLEKDIAKISADEGFNTPDEFVKAIIDIYRNGKDKKVFRFGTPLYTHYYRVVACPERVRHLYDWKEGGQRLRCPECETTFSNTTKSLLHAKATQHWGDYNG